MRHCPTCGELIPEGTTGCDACGSKTGSVILVDADGERERTDTDSSALGAARVAIARKPAIAELSYVKALVLLVPTALLSGLLAAWLAGRSAPPIRETEPAAEVLEPAAARWFCWTQMSWQGDKEAVTSTCTRSLETCRDSQSQQALGVDQRGARITGRCVQSSAVFCPAKGNPEKAICHASLDGCLAESPSCRLVR